MAKKAKKEPPSLEEQLSVAVSGLVSSHPDGLDGKKIAKALRYLADIYEDDDDEPADRVPDHGHP